jgi:hypothetical protein
MPRKGWPILHDGSSHEVDGPSQAQSQPSAEDVRAQLDRLYGPQDGALLAEGARKAGFPVPDTTAAETALHSGVPQR